MDYNQDLHSFFKQGLVRHVFQNNDMLLAQYIDIPIVDGQNYVYDRNAVRYK